MDITFELPVWLVWFYHCMGTISFLLNTFTIYLALFKSDTIDNFRYCILVFQVYIYLRVLTVLKYGISASMYSNGLLLDISYAADPVVPYNRRILLWVSGSLSECFYALFDGM